MSFAYSRKTGDTAEVDQGEVEALLQRRSTLRDQGDYAAADAILRRLKNDLKVDLDDRSKMWKAKRGGADRKSKASQHKSLASAAGEPVNKKGHENKERGLAFVAKKLRVIKPVGEGGAGQAFLVRLENEDKLVVLKKIICRNSATTSTAMQEARIVFKNLEHPHVVQYIDLDFAFDPKTSTFTVNLILEYYPGGDLCQFIESHQERQIKIEEQVVFKMMTQMAEALVYLHAHNIIHRDLKTDNVFLKGDGDIVLGDFGVAASIEDGNRETVVGTLVFFAPETLEGMPYNEKVDIWGLGCIFLELVGLHHMGLQEDIPLACQIKENPINVDKMPSYIGQDLRCIAIRALSMDSRERPTADELVKDLGSTAAAKDEKLRRLEEEQACLNEAVQNMRLEVAKDRETLRHVKDHNVSAAAAKPAPCASPAVTLSAPKPPVALPPAESLPQACTPSVPLAASKQLKATSMVVSDLPAGGAAFNQELTSTFMAKVSCKKQGLIVQKAPTMAPSSSSSLGKDASAPDKRFACQYCPKVYTNPDTLIVHLRLQHKFVHG